MKILFLHNRYLQRGGEDVCKEEEELLLKRNGHHVIALEESNERVEEIGRLRTALKTVWAAESYAKVREAIRNDRPDIISVHNFFPLLSPSVYYAASSAGIPVVQTLHNYRLLCVNACLFRDGRICEDCVGKPAPVSGVLHACYRNSRPGSLAVCAMAGLHSLAGTWQRQVTLYIALTEFAKNKFVESGLPKEKIVVKPNFILEDPGVRSKAEGFALFVGRLSEEKGALPMALAWKRGGFKQKLLIAGDGPQKSWLEDVARSCDSIALLGRISSSEVIGLMKRAAFLLFPSVWYEGMPRTIIEAFACGLPVIASNLGGMREMVSDGRTGRLFSPSDPEDLDEKIRWAWSDGGGLERMGRAARREFEKAYSAGRNYELLMATYKKAVEMRRA